MGVKIPTKTDVTPYVDKALQMFRTSGNVTINIRGILLRSQVWSIAKSKGISRLRLATFLGTTEGMVWGSFVRDGGTFMEEVSPTEAETIANFLQVPVEEIYRVDISVV